MAEQTFLCILCLKFNIHYSIIHSHIDYIYNICQNVRLFKNNIYFGEQDRNRYTYIETIRFVFSKRLFIII